MTPVVAPPIRAIAPFTKPLPVSVTVKLPVATGFGVAEVIVGPAAATLT